jgi:indole-3-glycerol phosphate synthase/phosphoribosylanthranilate isomerase
VVLERIVARKREEVALAKARGDARRAPELAPSTRSLEAALRRGRAAFVLECKRASPSAGVLRADYRPAEIARAYAPYADAVSVLTDAEFFGGSYGDLAAVSAAVAVPVLCKDVVVDPCQLRAARRHGADAALLMLSVLDDAAFAACAAEAARLGLDAVVEVRDEAELARALALGARIVGINNRDLATLRVDLAVTERLAPLVPKDRVVLSESGIRGRGDVRRLAGRVDGFLVGSALMARRDLERACRELVYGAVKICGITRPEDAAAAAGAGAIFGGLVFAPGSPRALDPEAAARLAALPGLAWVGVFVDEAEERVASLAERLGLAAVQMHGAETPAYASRLRARLGPAREVWKAHRVRGAVPEVAATGADRLLLDGRGAGRRGGGGRRFDWALLDGRELSRVIVAGGVDAECAAAADARGPYAIDLSSAVEERPGIKSAARLDRLFASLRPPARSVP